MSRLVSEAFQELQGIEELEESTFDFSNRGAADLHKFLKKEKDAKPSDTVTAVDPDADTEGDIKDSYRGYVLCMCPICHGYVTKRPEDLELDEDSGRVNVDEECPSCLNDGGFIVVAQIKGNADGSIEKTQIGDEDDEPELDFGDEDETFGVSDEPVEEFVDDFAGGDDDDEEDDDIIRDLEALNDEEEFEDDYIDDDAEPLNDEEDTEEDEEEDEDGSEEDSGTRKRGKRVPDTWNQIADELDKIDVDSDEEEDEEATRKYEVNAGGTDPDDPDAENSIMVRAKEREDLDYAIEVAEKYAEDGVTYTVGLDKTMKNPYFLKITIPEDKISDTGYFFLKEGTTIDITNSADSPYDDTEDDLNIDKEHKTINIKKTLPGDIHISVDCDEENEKPFDQDAEMFGDVDEDGMLESDNTEGITEDEDEAEDEEAAEGEDTEETAEEETEGGDVLGDIDADIVAEIENSAEEDEEETENELEGELSDEEAAELAAEEETLGGEEEEAEGAEETLEGEEAAAEGEEEEEETEEREIEDIGEEEFNELGEAYLKEVYGNVKSFKTTQGSVTKNEIVLEGIIELNNGKKVRTNFVFYDGGPSVKGKYRFFGENLQISKNKKAYVLTAALQGKKLLPEALTYNYNARNKGDKKSTRVGGRIKLNK